MCNLNENVPPFPSILFSAHIFQPRDSRILFDINIDFEANFVNN